jgi:hypothetical protein
MESGVRFDAMLMHSATYEETTNNFHFWNVLEFNGVDEDLSLLPVDV